MPNRRQNFKEDWCTRKDVNDRFVGEYLRPVSNDKCQARCIWCNSIFSIADGYNSVSKHVSSMKHISVMNGQRQQSRILSSFSSAKSMQQKQDEQLASEILWSVFIASHASFNAVSETSKSMNLFARLFPNDTKAQNFACGKTKATYLINNAVSPHLSEEIFSSLRKSMFTLCLDETNNDTGYKQLDLTAIYWCDTLERIRVEFLHSIYMKIDSKKVI